MSQHGPPTPWQSSPGDAEWTGAGAHPPGPQYPYPHGALPGFTPPPRPRRRVWPWAWGGAAVLAVIAGIVVVLAVTSQPPSASLTSAHERMQAEMDLERGEDEPFVYAVSSHPEAIDPMLTRWTGDHRVTGQIFDTLVRHESGGVAFEAGLAEQWSVSDDGREWTFQLREAVVFHDGDDLDAEAVCANFERWEELAEEHLDGLGYWSSTLGHGEAYRGCRAEGMDVVLELSAPTARLPGVLTDPAFGIFSPSTVERAAQPDWEDTMHESGALAGSGPYRLVEKDDSSRQVVVERNDDYWGDPAAIKTLEFREVNTAADRHVQLESGELHGYGEIEHTDLDALDSAGMQLQAREPFNIIYLGMHHDSLEELADPSVRQALAHALDREAFVDQHLPEGSGVATQFVPETAEGWSPDVTTYDYDPEASAQLLEDADAEGLEVEMCVPIDGDRAYMPDMQAMSESVAANLEALGIEVELTSVEWFDYLMEIHEGECPLYLHGMSGTYNGSWQFLGSMFPDLRDSWGFEDEDVFEAVNAVDAAADEDSREQAGRAANETVMDFLPGAPIAHGAVYSVYAADVDPAPASPLLQERFADMWYPLD